MSRMRYRYRYGATLTKDPPPVRERSEQLRRRFAPLAQETAPPPAARPMSYMDGYFIWMNQKDRRKRDPRMPPAIFGRLRREAWTKEESKTHKARRQHKHTAIYIPKARRKKKPARKKVRKTSHPRSL